MLQCGRPFILLFILIDCLIFSLESSPSSPSHNGTRPRSGPSGGMTEDYDDLYGITTTPPNSPFTNSEPPDRDFCDYDMCVEQQQTCHQLAELTGCLCRGMSSLFELPNPPSLSSLTQKGDRGVVVRWCAPTSILTHYNVSLKVKGKVEHMKVEERKRMVVLEDVRAGALVCVIAVNKGGSSIEDKQSCEEFQPQRSDSGLALKLGIIGGAVGLILLLILGLLLWRHKTRQKSAARPETEGVL